MHILSVDLTGVLACATSYHIYHSLKFGNSPLITKAIETGMFSQVRAFAFSSAKAFCNEFDIKSNGLVLCCDSSGLSRNSLTSGPDQATFNHHFQGPVSLDN